MTEFKPGDRVVLSSSTAPDAARRVLAVHEDWVWTLREGYEPVGVRAGALKPAPGPFFEKGKIYTRWTDWSIWAQRRNVTEEFTVLDVRENSDDNRIAFGRIRVTGDVGADGKLAYRHVTLGEHHYRSEKWKAIT